jgi:hypothetical protein
MALGLHPVEIKLYSKKLSKVEYGDDLGLNVSEWATFGIDVVQS